jgi:osmoprotectant transport system ATP-binding protein
VRFLVRFENVSKKYNQLEVVKNLNLEINEGELVTLIGPSGCGKTTTLKMINRLIEPTSGTIYVNGEDIRKQDPVQLRRGIGYVIQQIGLFPNMTIAQNIAVVGKLLGWSKEKAAARVEELLEMVNMDPASYMDRYPKELSGGQQQRIGVLRALAANPKIILQCKIRLYTDDILACFNVNPMILCVQKRSTKGCGFIFNLQPFFTINKE